MLNAGCAGAENHHGSDVVGNLHGNGALAGFGLEVI
jgi:hypothetical protein